MLKIMITGANGFVGRRLLTYLDVAGHKTRAVVRRPSVTVDVPGDSMVVGAIDADTDWQAAVEGCDVVVHLAARVHVMHETEQDPLVAFRRVNLQGSIALANAAVKAGVKRFVYISSIKVNGEATYGQAFGPQQAVDPHEPYALSKWEAEQALQALGEESGMEVVIIRPPLVYGPGVKANFLSLVKLANKGVPLPLGGIKNRRTMVALENLVDLIKTCCEHPAAAGQVFLAADDETVSTGELVGRISRALGRPSRVFYFPPVVMALIAKLVHKEAIWHRLAGSLEVDNSAAKTMLDWTPVVSMDEQLQQLADWFLKDRP